MEGNRKGGVDQDDNRGCREKDMRGYGEVDYFIMQWLIGYGSFIWNWRGA